jgi:hypothetical protein
VYLGGCQRFGMSPIVTRASRDISIFFWAVVHVTLQDSILPM